MTTRQLVWNTQTTSCASQLDGETYVRFVSRRARDERETYHQSAERPCAFDQV